MRAPALAVVLAFLLPLAAAQEAPEQAQPPEDPASDDAVRPATTITFYGHVFGNTLARPMPANTVPPIGDSLTAFWQDHQCFDDPTGQVANTCDEDPINKLVLFTTAGPVQVHSSEDFNYTMLHNEHGRAKDVYLDTTQDIQAWFYAAADFFSYPIICADGGPMPPDVGCPLPIWGWDPGIIPGFTVEATMYMAELGEYGQGASEPPPIAETIPTATIVAHGATEPQDLQTGLPGAQNVQEFVVNLGKPLVPLVPKEYDLFIVYSWYETVNGQKVGVDYMKPWAGEQFPVRFTLPVRNPFDVELVVPQFLHDKVVIHGVMSTPWGSYDIDLASAALDLTDAGNRPVEARSIERFGDYQVAHGAHYKPVNFTWVWDHKADGVSPGGYKATVRACNHQHSACSATEAFFSLGPDGRPGEVRIGRSGQTTASEALLRDLTEGVAGQVPGGEAVQPTAGGAAEASPQGPKGAPGFEAPAVLGAAVVALAAARRRA